MNSANKNATGLRVKEPANLSAEEMLEFKTKELEEAYKKIADLEKTRQYFASAVSHELRNPLTSVLGFAITSKKYFENDILPAIPESAEKVKRRSGRIRENLSIVISEGERLICLINDILGVARMEVDNLEWNIQEVNIISVCKRALSALVGYPRKKEVEINFKAPDIVPSVNGDPDLLVLVIVNLIKNALKFTEQGSVDLNVEKTDENVKISVIDTGRGMEKDVLSTIFDKFADSNNVAVDDFLMKGLGIPKCKEIIEKLGGSITINSTLGKGSRICFTLIYCSAEEHSAAGNSAVELEGGESIAGITANKIRNGMPNVLIIDDNINVLRLLNQELEENHNITLVDNSKTALDLLKDEAKEFAYDLVITDLMMKDLDGIGVLKEVKRLHPETMVIILTGYGDLDSAIDALRLGADDYIVKPYNSEKFHFSVKRCLEKLKLNRKIKLYENILPVCCVCNKIRDDSGKAHGSGQWHKMEAYIMNKTKVKVSHSYCPECYENARKSCNKL